ncbi:MAG: hypothetical protein PWQ61_1582 [Betaproteobacteria bacterium]|nr:hypothetical protein [Betaproteobacteria bacterium]
MSTEVPSPEYLSFGEVQARWGCTETDLRRWILGRKLVASYFFSHDVARVVKSFSHEEKDGVSVWVPALEQREHQDENSGLSPYKLAWINGFYFLVNPNQKGPFDGTFSFLSPEKDFDERVGGECYWYSPKSKPCGLSMEDVFRNGALMLSEIERFERETLGSARSTGQDESAQNSGRQSKPRLRKDAILEELRKLGYDPLALPPIPTGKRWVKSEVKSRLTGPRGLFLDKGKTFDKAWEELSTAKEIIVRERG